MVYLVYGYQKPLVDKRIKELIKQDQIELDDFDINIYDLEQVQVKDLISDVTTVPMLNSNKVVIGRNPFYMTSNKDIKIENDYDELHRYLNNPNDFSTLIFVSYEKIDGKNETVKLIKKTGTIIEVNDFKKEEWPDVIKRLFLNRKVTIEPAALSAFISKVGPNLTLAISEVDKLATYNDYIRLEDVKALVSSPLEDDVFALTNAIIDRDYGRALKVFKDLKIQSHEPIALLPIIANQMRFMYQVFYLYQQKLSEKQIVDELMAHPYRVSLTLGKVRRLNEQALLEVNHQLAKLDQDIKSGLIDRFQGFELFIINQLKGVAYGKKA